MDEKMYTYIRVYIHVYIQSIYVSGMQEVTSIKTSLCRFAGNVHASSLIGSFFP